MVDRFRGSLANCGQVLKLFLPQQSIGHSFAIQVSLSERLSIRILGIHISQKIILVLPTPLSKVVIFLIELVNILKVSLLLVVKAWKRRWVVLNLLIIIEGCWRAYSIYFYLLVQLAIKNLEAKSWSFTLFRVRVVSFCAMSESRMLLALWRSSFLKPLRHELGTNKLLRVLVLIVKYWHDL